MGIVNTVESMAIGHAVAEHSCVARALIDELDESEGVGALVQCFQRNGMGSFIEQWSEGKTEPCSAAVEDGLHGSSLIERISKRTHYPTGVVRGALVVIVPILVDEMISGHRISLSGQVLGTEPDSGRVLERILGRLSRRG